MFDLDLLLRMLTWLAVNRATTLDEISQTFGVPRAKVAELLEMARWAGFGPHYGETMDIEIFEDGDVSVRDTLGMDRPLHVNALQAAAILAGLDYLAEVATVADTTEVRELADRLRAVLPPAADVVSVVPGTHQKAVTEVLRKAIADRTQVIIVYASAGAQNDPERVIEPVLMSPSEDLVYVDAWCHSAKALRSFRVDRIVEATPIGAPAVAAVSEKDIAQARAGWITVDMTLGMDHVGDFAPNTIVARKDEGRTVHMTVRVASLEWLAGVLLAAGGGITVHDQPRMYEIARGMRDQWRDSLGA